MNNLDNIVSERFVNDISLIITNGQRQAYIAAAQAAVSSYWNIGRRIVEDEQRGEAHARYGSNLIPGLAQRLSAVYGNSTISVIFSITADSIFCLPILKKCTSYYTFSHPKKAVGRIRCCGICMACESVFL